MLLAVVVSVASASVEVAPDAPCVDAGFAQKLSSAGVGVPSEAALTLRRARADVLEVTLTPRGAAPMRREVPATARDCAGVDRVVVALLKAWLTSPVMKARAGRDGGDVRQSTPVGDFTDGGAPSSSRPGEASVSPGATAQVVDGGVADGGALDSAGRVKAPLADGGALRFKEGAAVVGSTRLAEAGVKPPPLEGPVVNASQTVLLTDGGSQKPSSLLEPVLVASADGGGPLEVAGAEVAPDAGLDAPRWLVGVGVLGGIASGTTPDVLPQGLLTLDVTRGWFGAALDVGLSGAVSRQVAPGAVTSSWQWLSLSARAGWSPLQRVSLEAQLGLRGHRIAAVASGYSETKPQQQLVSVGAVGSVGASVRILGPVGLTLRATGVLKPPERFTIENLGPVLDLGALEGGVHAGVVVRW